MNAMNARRILAGTGALTLYGADDNAFIDGIRSAARHEDLNWNNGTWNGEAFDPLRVRARLPTVMSRACELMFRRHCMTFFSHLTALDWSLIRTLAGATYTPVPRDFPPPLPDIHAAESTELSAVLLVATQDDAVLYGYGWNHLVALRSNEQVIVLNKGDMIMFRGDYIYALAGYQTNNLVFHTYLDTPQYPREIEGTEPHLVAVVDDLAVPDDSPFCYVYKREFVASSTTSLRKHMNRFHSFYFRPPRH